MTTSGIVSYEYRSSKGHNRTLKSHLKMLPSLAISFLFIVTTLHNVCSVHPGVFSTLEDTLNTSGGYHEYIGGMP